MSEPEFEQAVPSKKKHHKKHRPAVVKPLTPIPSDLPKTYKMKDTHDHRARMIVRLFSIMESPLSTNHAKSYLQEFLDKILQSEFLMGKFLDKLLPTLTPETTNLLLNNFGSIGSGSFEERLAALRLQREAAEGGLRTVPAEVISAGAPGNGVNGKESDE